MIDTHAHLYLPDFDDDRNAVIGRARDAGVKKIYLPNIDESTIPPMLELCAEAPGFCFPMIGLHPCSVKEDWEQQMSSISGHLKNQESGFAAIGEIGTDLYWDKTFRDEQEACFRYQIELAIDHDLPIVIHSRESLDWNIGIVSEYTSRGVRGVFHCFTGSAGQGKKIIEMGFYLGIGGVITFKNSGLKGIVSELPMESLVLETDSPYLTPHPHRGKRNESSYLTLVTEAIADCHEISTDEVVNRTTENAQRLFEHS